MINQGDNITILTIYKVLTEYSFKKDHGIEGANGENDNREEKDLQYNKKTINFKI
jgi:hypothetical protein